MSDLTLATEDVREDLLAALSFFAAGASGNPNAQREIHACFGAPRLGHGTHVLLYTLLLLRAHEKGLSLAQCIEQVRFEIASMPVMGEHRG